MITSKQALARYGSPVHEAGMVLWDVPKELEIGVIPKRIYCNRDLVVPLRNAFENLIERKYVRELVTWDGCFNIRPIRGAVDPSLHSWGLAIDVNAAWNRLGQKPQLTPGFVKCFTDAGFDWGGEFDRVDGMHFQLAEFPK
jgi:hypothetical protein